MYQIKRDGDKVHGYFLGLPIFYSRRLENSTRYRLLFFRWERKKTELEIKVDKLDERLKIIEKKSGIFKSMFPFSDVRKNSVLLVESNNFHSELLPGIAYYFIQLGYHVDVLLSYYENKLEPFARYHYHKIRITSIKKDSILDLLRCEECDKYKYIYFNSDRVNYQKDISYEYFNSAVKAKENCIYMIHHLESFRNKNVAHALMLGDYVCALKNRPEIVVPVYYGNIQIKPKREKTRFIVIGNIDPKRKNFEMLIKTLKDKTILSENFEVAVIARTGDLDIPEDLKSRFVFLGKLSYSQMYNEIENSDYILTLLDHEVSDHLRYRDWGISGSILLCYGFRKPCLIDSYFAEKYQYNNQNALIYTSHLSFKECILRAIKMNETEYLNMQLALSDAVNDIYEQSIKNLSRIVKNVRDH